MIIELAGSLFLQLFALHKNLITFIAVHLLNNLPEFNAERSVVYC
jgi:hypothetical protein